MRVTPRVGVAAVVLLGFVAYAALAQLVSTPRVFYDELLYMEAADSLASGEGLEVRGAGYERGVLYPALLAPVLAASPDREVGYELVKLLNALFFALAAIPVYLLARRLLEPWPSVGVAALAVAIPSSVYVSVVMTESLAYLSCCWALYAIASAVERPTLLRQLVALLTIALAVLTRAQFVVLYAAYLLALVLAFVFLPSRRVRPRASLRALWPTGLSLALGLAAFGLRPLVRGDSPADALGEYSSLERLYDPVDVATWFVSHLADLTLYLAVVPMAVAPIVLAAYYARSREGSEPHGAFLAVFLAVNAALLLVVAFVVADFERTGLGTDRLQDRYVFYVVPLWLIVLVAWIVSGAPRPVRALGLGIGLALLLTVLLPYGELDVNDGVRLFSAVGSALPAAMKEIAGSTLAGALVVFVLALGLVGAVLRWPARAARISICTLVAVFAVNGLLVWAQAFDPPVEAVFDGSRLERRWVDELVPEEATVAMVYAPCGEAPLPRDSFFVTEFFNSSIERVVEIGGDFPTGDVARSGNVVDGSGEPLAADYVVVQPGVRPRGDELGSGTSAGLSLWETRGPIRLDGVRSAGELTLVACGTATP